MEQREPKIFLSYAKEWESSVEVLYRYLQQSGCKPWMDKIDLLPGQYWKLEIPKAIRESDIFLACVSRQFIGERRYLQREIKIAIDVLQEIPTGKVFIIPIRLEPNCDIPVELQEYQWDDYFIHGSIQRIISSISKHLKVNLKNPPIFHTWEKTPVILQEFSPLLLNEMDKALEETLILLNNENILTKLKQGDYYLSKEINKQIMQIQLNGTLDIDITCFNENNKYIIHPWPSIRGSNICITMFNENAKLGFEEWFWKNVENMDVGYLTWVDQSSSNPALGHQIFIEKWSYERKTIVSFYRFPIEKGRIWTVVIEGHQVSKVK